MKIKIRYFALYEELKNKSEENLTLKNPVNLKSIFLKAMADFPLKEHYLKATLFAINQQYADPNTVPQDGDEIVFIPPIAGG